jgi:hypothetical protein
VDDVVEHQLDPPGKVLPTLFMPPQNTLARELGKDFEGKNGTQRAL